MLFFSLCTLLPDCCGLAIKDTAVEQPYNAGGYGGKLFNFTGVTADGEW